ncbi:MAG: electron transfer flavoprotein subunit alpha/FixB family protein [Gemmatimonadetes bacterium]|nr:electron transfer flavoprotein subunit alpha/FixB family protein [Gemmatimonadota bacterium]
MADVLAVVEQKDGVLRVVSAEVVTAAADVAAALGGEVHALLLGGAGVADAAALLGEHGAARVRVGAHESLEKYQPEMYAAAVAAVARTGGYAAVLFAATSQGKDLAPRVAALLDVPLATEATALDASGGVLTAIRPVYAGKAFVRVRSDATPFVISLRPNAFPPKPRPAAGTVETFAPELGTPRTRVREFRASTGGALDVGEASIVVSGGRGMKDPAQWSVLEQLREALGEGCALGASRAVVDAGWRPHGEQVGQTGKTVAPKLYFAIGISGAIQHLAGMRTSGTIVAVNKDPDAPIFKVADYGIVGDLFEVIPRLAEEIRARCRR